MRFVLLIGFLLLAANDAFAQPCGGLGGSGWRLKITESRKISKCVGCDEVVSRCKTPPTTNCTFTGCPNIHAIRRSCPQHLQPGLCPLK